MGPALPLRAQLAMMMVLLLSAEIGKKMMGPEATLADYFDARDLAD